MNRKGFTLVELLAVIAILAILVIIALPNIMGMFNDAREKSFTTETKEIYKVAQQQWVSDSLYGTGEKVYSNTKTDSCANKLNLSGRKNLEYYIKINKGGKVTEYYATDGTYQYTYEGQELLIQDIDSVTQVAKLTDSDAKITITCTGVDFEFTNPVTGDPDLGNYFIASRNKYYDTFKDAIDHASSNQTIQVLSGTTESETVTVPASIHNLKIDVNGNYVNFYVRNAENDFVNNGEIEIINTSEYQGGMDWYHDGVNNGTITFNGDIYISSELDILQNYGTINMKKGDVGSRECSTFVNHGTVNMTGGKIGGNYAAVENYKTFNMTGGEIYAGGIAVQNYSGGTSTISNIDSLQGFKTAIGNEQGGTVTITNTGIKSTYAYSTYGIKNSGNVTVNNSTITTSSSSTGYESRGILNNQTGVMQLSNVTINSSNGTSGSYNGYQGIGIDNKGTITANNTSVHSIYLSTNGPHGSGIINSGTITFIGGEITSPLYAIEQNGGTFTLGSNDGTVSTTSPLVNCTSTAGIGLKINGGTFNFYDGIIKSSAGTGYSINGTPVVPSGYSINKVTSGGVESATLTH